MATITVENVVKQYGDFTAVDGISLAITSGETYGLLGPNGAGKTTTMRMIAGLCPMTAGSIHVDQLSVARDSRAIRKTLGIVTQQDGLDEALDVRTNLIVYAELMGLAAGESGRRVDEILDFFQLTDKSAADVNDLSGGMKRRVAIARALIGQPKAIILDEPSTGLDPESRIRVWEELAALKKQGVTLVISTHYMDEAELLCDRIAMMHAGTILDIGTPEELIERHGGEPSIDVRPRGRTRDEVRESLIASGLGFREVGTVFRVACPDESLLASIDGVSITPRKPNLEDVFLKVAGRGLVDDE